MDNQEFVHSWGAELALVLSEREGTIPEPRPLNVSPWLAMSILQKSLRRGETGHALRAAATLLHDDPDKLWRRLTVAAYEDVGLGSLDLISPVLIATSSKSLRRQFGGDWVVASVLVERLAQARKCRAADDLLMTVIAHPAYEATRLEQSYLTLPELMRIATGSGDIVTRAIALFYALGTDRCPVATMATQKGDPTYAFECMRDAGAPFTVLELARRGLNRVREPLPAFMSLASFDVPGRSTGFQPTEKDDDILPTVMIGDVPAWAVDYYVREGRACFRKFLKSDTPTGNWLRKNVPSRNRVEALGALVFRVEGGLMRRRLRWPTGQNLRAKMEFEAVGFGVSDAGEALDLLRNDLPGLNTERHHAV